jgi:energy-coupling factor transporter transmembrane protein EcfT
VPLLVNLFRRADEFALAMELRAYDPDKPGRELEEIKFRNLDFITILIIIVFSSTLIVL